MNPRLELRQFWFFGGENQSQRTISFGYFNSINQTIIFMTGYQEYSQTHKGKCYIFTKRASI
jgi:hypothetical protein